MRISTHPLYGAENEARTRDPNLGKVMLYQLSYFRKSGEGNETRTHTTILSLPPQSSASTNSAIPPDWIEISLCRRAQNKTRTCTSLNTRT